MPPKKHMDAGICDTTDGAVDGERGNRRCRQKKRKTGHVKECWHGFDGLGQAERLHALVQ
jgi:hypothetical protein